MEQCQERSPKRKKDFSVLCIFDIGGDEKIRTSDPGFAQMLP
jgi:hypothetical protein